MSNEDLCGSCGAWCCKDEDIFELKGSSVIKRCTCPNLKDDKCSIYEMRPIECKLFPWDVIEIDTHPYMIKWFPESCKYEGISEEEAYQILLDYPDWVKACLKRRAEQGFHNKYARVKFMVVRPL